MFKAQKGSDKHCDNNNAILHSDVNCSTAIAKRSFFAPRACASKRKRQFNLRKCKSDSNVNRRHSAIDRMGSSISRSKSCDNIETDSIVYESMSEHKKADEKSLCSFDDSDEDYKLLESTEHDDSDCGEDGSGCVTTNAENDTPISASNCNFIQQKLPRAGNEIENDLLCKKYSTLPRVKYKNGVTACDQLLRCSVPYKSFDNRAHCSKEEIMNDFQVVSNKQLETAEVSETLEATIESDKQNDFTATSTPFRSTTLPKTRSRLSEPYSRHSLRQAIDSTMPRKQLKISDALENNAAIIPDDNDMSEAGAGKRFI